MKRTGLELWRSGASKRALAMLSFSRKRSFTARKHRPVWHDVYEQVTQLQEDIPLKGSFKDLCCWVIIEAATTRQCYVAQDGNKAQGVRRR